ncbi:MULTISPECIES: hypothetical protein [unclassified Enterococcus]|jgi:hypothetical protein|uniref:hypothetical protein n=1 Tax=unclassified Enterococcus TaxID=2608891 RepID=UPI000A350707|nr:hypothetical protein [Enterococcus mundtii]OTO90142.1 hypothetical protein A5852_003483 [Enterococcus faecium]
MKSDLLETLATGTFMIIVGLILLIPIMAIYYIVLGIGKLALRLIVWAFFKMKNSTLTREQLLEDPPN